MSAAAKLHTLTEPGRIPIPADPRVSAGRRVARDFALLLVGALAIGLAAGLGMMLAVLLLA